MAEGRRNAGEEECTGFAMELKEREMQGVCKGSGGRRNARGLQWRRKKEKCRGFEWKWMK